jgi:molybdopterin molybdotransferase
MISFEQALATILARVPTLDAEVVPLREAAGRVLRERVAAPRPVPPADNSGFDGVAFRAADAAGASPASPVRLRLVGEVAAGGRREHPIGAGEAVRIMTGAPVPPGVDAVLGVEDVRFSDGFVHLERAAPGGSNIRLAGEDLRAGDVPVVPGTRLGAAALGVLASMGRDRVEVARRPRVVVLGTGNELLAPGAPWREGAIYSSNSMALAAHVVDAGGVAIDQGLVSDDLASTEAALERAFQADVVLTSGGVSMGEYDHVRDAAARVGVEHVFWQVAVQPGKPFFFGLRGVTPLFGLPGNPSSALLVFEELVRPALLAMQGATRVTAPLFEAVLDAPVRRRAGRLGLVRATLRVVDGVPHVTPQQGQGSGILSSLATAEAVIRVPAEVAELPAGARVRVRLLGWRESA